MNSLGPDSAGGAPRPVFSNTSLIVLILLLLGSTTINFIDRQVLSVLAPVLRDEFRLTNSGYAAIVNAFMLSVFKDRERGIALSTTNLCWDIAYAAGMFLGGVLIEARLDSIIYITAVTYAAYIILFYAYFKRFDRRSRGAPLRGATGE